MNDPRQGTGIDHQRENHHIENASFDGSAWPEEFSYSESGIIPDQNRVSASPPAYNSSIGNTTGTSLSRAHDNIDGIATDWSNIQVDNFQIMQSFQPNRSNGYGNSRQSPLRPEASSMGPRNGPVRPRSESSLVLRANTFPGGDWQSWPQAEIAYGPQRLPDAVSEHRDSNAEQERRLQKAPPPLLDKRNIFTKTADFFLNRPKLHQWELGCTSDAQKVENARKVFAGFQKEREDYGKIIHELEKKVKSRNSDIENHKREKAQHANYVASFEQKINNVKVNHTQEIARLARKHESEQEEERKMLEESFNTEKVRFERAKKTEISKLKQGYGAELDNKERTINRLRHEHTILMVEKNNEMEMRLANQAANYDAIIQKMRDDADGLREALLTNDNDRYRGELFTASGLPAKPDDKIYAQFSVIEQIVEQFGRLKWKEEPLLWTEEVLLTVQGVHVERTLKKAIVQDLVWSLLHYYIFSSPFRVFHEEGRSLETQWSLACGQGSASDSNLYDWPEPSTKTERWRYMTIRECKALLRPPVPSEIDPRSRVRKGYVQGQMAFLTAARTSLANLIDLSETDTDLLKKLGNKAATVWLDFAMYRCRILINLMGPAELDSMEAKVARAQSDCLELTVLPSLGRHGNVSGADLDNYSTINAREGSSICIQRERRIGPYD